MAATAPKYSELEIERRWRVDPSALPVLEGCECREIEDMYLDGGRLRLRRVVSENAAPVLKLGKKYPAANGSPASTVSVYLDEAEFAALLVLPGRSARKRRYSLDSGALDLYLVPDPGFAVFEAEFASEEEAARFEPPGFVGLEITHRVEYSGYALAAEAETASGASPATAAETTTAKVEPLQPAAIAQGYDQLAAHWDGPAFPRDNGMAQHRRALAFAKRQGHALDLGCGSSGRIIELLRQHGFVVEGVDLSEQMLERARRRHPDVQFHRADISAWVLPRSYDFISAWDSIWHLPLRHQEPVLQRMLRGLAPGGVCIFTMGGLDGPGEKVDSAMGPPMYYSTPGIPNALKAISAAGCVCRHLEYDQYPQPHLYVIAQRC